MAQVLVLARYWLGLCTPENFLILKPFVWKHQSFISTIHHQYGVLSTAFLGSVPGTATGHSQLWFLSTHPTCCTTVIHMFNKAFMQSRGGWWWLLQTVLVFFLCLWCPVPCGPLSGHGCWTHWFSLLKTPHGVCLLYMCPGRMYKWVMRLHCKLLCKGTPRECRPCLLIFGHFIFAIQWDIY
jgi:hypothetical protein